jgi:hypothetical protein
MRMTPAQREDRFPVSVDSQGWWSVGYRRMGGMAPTRFKPLTRDEVKDLVAELQLRLEENP